MRKIHVHALAESDLIGIWQYSFEELDELDSAIRKLADNPERGMRRDYVREGYRVLFVSRHAVYYTVTPDAVHFIRVLHGRMDPDRHLE
jgi:toxin ParE1/3/4